jgi:hypothetical protein
MSCSLRWQLMRASAWMAAQELNEPADQPCLGKIYQCGGNREIPRFRPTSLDFQNFRNSVGDSPPSGSGSCRRGRGCALRKKLRKYPGLNTPLGIPGVFPGVFSLLVYFWPFWGYFGTKYPKALRLGYFAWCIPKVTAAPTRGTFALN